MGQTTDELIALSLAVHPNPPKREQDMLVSVGERVSMTLLAMALDVRGIKAVSFTGSQSGIITDSNHLQAEIVAVEPKRIEQALEEGKVVIVAGFQGISREGEVTTLGRGGSDTTAVAVGTAIGAEKVEFYKDVPGISSNDPKQDPKSKVFSKLSYTQALEIIDKGSEVLHLSSLKWAQKHSLRLEVRPFYEPEQLGTSIG